MRLRKPSLAGYKNHWYFKEDMGGVKVIRVKMTSDPLIAQPGDIFANHAGMGDG